MFFDKYYDRDEPISEYEVSNQVPHQFRTNSAPICHETAWKYIDLHIGKVLGYEIY